MSQPRPRVIVIGGGLIGASSAYFLSEHGWQVTVIDRGTFGGGCSHANCGFVSPSHVLPLAEPGAWMMALKSLFRRNSPLCIRLGTGPALWGWLWQFARRCNHADMIESGHGIHALLASSIELFHTLIEKEGLQCEWQTRGILFAYRDREPMERFAQTDKLLREEFHEPAERYDGEALNQLEPALLPGLAGAWFYPQDCHLRPDRLMSSWQQKLGQRGVEIREHCALTGFVNGAAGRAAAIRTTQGELAADAFVVATGAWTPQLRQWLGGRIPIQPGKGYSITMSRPEICPKIPMIFPQCRVAVTPMLSGYRLGSTMEFAGYDTRLKPERLRLLREGAKDYLQQPLGARVDEEWFGWRPMTYDSRPIIDRSPAMSNVWIAAGHNMLGLSMSTGTGRLVAELVDGRDPHIDPRPYSAARFG